jgi:beta-glucosidase
LLEGLRELASGIEILHARGPDPNPQHGVFAGSVFECEQGTGLWGEYFDNNQLEGEPAVRRLDERLDFSWGVRPPADGITEKQFSVRWTGALRPAQSGLHVFHSRSHDSEYRIWVGDQLVIDTWSVPRNGPQRGELVLEAGRAHSVRVEYKKTRFFSGMQFGWHHSDGGAAETARCVELARRADVAIVTVGWDHVSEAEGFDRDFSMNREVENMLVAVAEAQPNTIVVLTAGGNLDMSRWIDRVRGVLHAFYPGQAGGQALAEIVFGLVNPSAKLPATFERRAEDRSSFGSYHDDDGDRRVALTDGVFTGYRHFDQNGIEPRFPFGFGLSYTTFAYSELSLSRQTMGISDSLTVKLTLENTGARAGAEIVQVYVADPISRLPRPPKELKGFARVALEPGQSRQVEIELSARAFELYDPELGRFVVEPGEFRVMAGASAADIRLSASCQIVA